MAVIDVIWKIARTIFGRCLGHVAIPSVVLVF
jgi:hypothetical protein